MVDDTTLDLAIRKAIIGYLRAVGITANLSFQKYEAIRESVRVGKVPVYCQT